MHINGWKYYNHAAIPANAPHEMPDLTPIKDGSIWRIGGILFFARWTTEWDCGHETNWWYVIKDNVYDIDSLKSKRRYEIKKGRNHFKVERINPSVWVNEIYDVRVKAFGDYPEKYRKHESEEQAKHAISEWGEIVYGAFDKYTKKLSGIATLRMVGDKCIDFTRLMAIPDCQKEGVNASIIDQMLIDYNEFIQEGGYICDGERNIRHETAFQNYLIKYFGFRKAYCILNLEFSMIIKPMIQFVWVFRKFFNQMDNIPLMHSINSVIKMVEIVKMEKTNG